MSTILNWAHVISISHAGEQDVEVDLAVRSDTYMLPASDITVVGEGSARVNTWLADVAAKTEEASDDE